MGQEIYTGISIISRLWIFNPIAPESLIWSSGAENNYVQQVQLSGMTRA